MNNIKILLIVFTMLLISSTVTAEIRSMTVTHILPISASDWTKNHVIEKFNPSSR